MAKLLVTRVSISSVAKPIYDPRLTNWVDEFRGHYGMKTLWRGQAESFKAILRVFRAQETFGILIDQDTSARVLSHSSVSLLLLNCCWKLRKEPVLRCSLAVITVVR